MKKSKKKGAKKKGNPKKASPKTTKAKGIVAELKGLYSFMKDNGLQTFAYSQGGLKVRLVRRGAAQVPVPVAVPTSGAAVGAATTPAGSNGSPGTPEAAPMQGNPIKAPLMGVFYRASSPSSPPFVKEGDVVSVGHTLGLVEAMKVFNEIKAEYKCKVLKALVENGKPVKSGQVIFLVENA